MASEKRQLELDILANAKTAAGTSQAARDLDKVGTAADAAGKKTDKFGKSTTIAGKEADKFGREAKNTAGKVNDLNDEIRNVERELVTLAAAFHAAGAEGERLDVSKAIRRTENDLRRITKSRDLLKGSLLPDPDPGTMTQWVNKLRGGVNSALASSGPLIGGAAILGTALAPTIGGIIAGAVLGGVGIGGIVGGIALAAKGNPAITDYAKRIGQDFAKNVNTTAKSAFTGPALDGLNQLEALAARTAPKVGQIFKNSAPGVATLTQALMRSADALVNSAVIASGKSGPAMESLGRIFQGTSESVAGFITMLADHSAEGASSLDDLNTALQNTIKFVTMTVDTLATIKGAFDDVDNVIDKTRAWLEDHSDTIDLTADGYKKGSEAAQLYRDGVIGVAGAVNDYDHYLAGSIEGTDKFAASQSNAARAASGHRDALAQLSNEMKAEADPVFALLNAQDNLATAQNNVAEATKKHGRNSNETKAALRRLAEAAIDLEGKAGALSTTFDGELSPSMRNTLHAAGLTDAEIGRIATQFRNAKKSGDAFARTYAATAKLTTIYKTIYQTNNEQSPSQGSAIRDRRASGGPVQRGTPYVVGENGPEIYVPDAAGRVLSAAASRGMSKVGMGPAVRGSWPAGGITAKIELVGQEEMRRMFRYMIRSMNLLETA